MAPVSATAIFVTLLVVTMAAPNDFSDKFLSSQHEASGSIGSDANYNQNETENGGEVLGEW